jgi:hypothetical protein
MTIRLCKLDDCDSKYYCKDYCVVHYTRWKRHGDPYFVTPPKDNPGVTKPRKPRSSAEDIIIGDTYGYWTVIGNFYRAGSNNDAFFPCVCKCGTEKDVKLRVLREAGSGKNGISCGCYHKEVMATKRKYFFEPGTTGYNWERTLWTEYKITTEQYHALLIGQSGLCAICCDQLIDPHIDHCHKTEQVRGLLCHHCNTMLGLARDDILILTNAINYLLKDY